MAICWKICYSTMVSINHSMNTNNQQERPETIGWITGFVDGEGCFSISIIRNQTTHFGWQVFPEFVVTQGEKSRKSLEFLKDYFRCGSIYRNRRHDNHKEDLLKYCVRSQKEIREKIIPFFNKNSLKTAKSNDFRKFKQILRLMEKSEHKNLKGLKKIASIIQTMNRKIPSKFLESSETKRHTPSE